MFKGSSSTRQGRGCFPKARSGGLFYFRRPSKFKTFPNNVVLKKSTRLLRRRKEKSRKLVILGQMLGSWPEKSLSVEIQEIASSNARLASSLRLGGL